MAAKAAPPKHLPPGARINKGKRSEKQCYSSSEFILLLKFDNAYDACLKTTANLKLQIAELSGAVANLSTANKLMGDANLALHAHVNKLFADWKKENKLRHVAENKPHITSWVGWTVAGVATAALAGFVINDLAN